MDTLSVIINENSDNKCEWDGNDLTYKVDPDGCRWVLKETQIPPISCPCLLCKYISNTYKSLAIKNN